MAKTKEELNQLKVEYETLNTKLQELTEDELKQVTGGIDILFFKSTVPDFNGQYKPNNDVDLNNHWSFNIEDNLTDDLIGNNANGSGGGVFNEGEL